jgi:putative glutamine amidotransferase
MRPIIGITTYVEPVGWAAWQPAPAALLPYSYVRAVTAAGARAVLLPPDDLDAGVLAALDGLVLAGGADVSPHLYGDAPGPLTDSRPDRDAGELALLTAALAADVPVLGVCRGMQLLVVAYGGRLHQHLPDVVGHHGHRPAPGVYGAHDVRFAPGSRIAGVMAGDVAVNTYHHQGVADPGGLTPTAWAPDGVIEAVEDPARAFVLGVQWHPEEAGDARPFAALAAAAGARTR